MKLRIASQQAAWVALLILTVVWGLNWIFMKVALEFSGAYAFSALRYTVGTVVIFALLFVRKGRHGPTPWIPTLIIGITQTAAFQALAQLALIEGGAGKTALLAYSMPFWVVPLAWWWLREKPGWFRWLCIAVAGAGYVFIVTPWQHLGDPLSVLLALASGLSWGIATVASKWTFERYPDVTPIRLTAWQMLIGTVILILLALVIPERRIAWNLEYVGAVLYSGLLSSSLGWALWAFVVQRLPATVSGLASLATPVASVLFGWWLLAERPSGPESLGIILIAVALLALNFSQRVRRGGMNSAVGAVRRE